MHDERLHGPPAQSCSGTAALVPANVDAGVSSLVDADPASSYSPLVPPAVLSDVAPPPSTHLSVCVSSFADISLTLHPGVGLSSFPIIQSTLLVDNCVNDFQEILQPPVNCDITSIQLQSLDNGYLPYDPYAADQSMR